MAVQPSGNLEADRVKFVQQADMLRQQGIEQSLQGYNMAYSEEKLDTLQQGQCTMQDFVGMSDFVDKVRIAVGGYDMMVKPDIFRKSIRVESIAQTQIPETSVASSGTGPKRAERLALYESVIKEDGKLSEVAHHKAVEAAWSAGIDRAYYTYRGRIQLGLSADYEHPATFEEVKLKPEQDFTDVATKSWLKYRDWLKSQDL